MNLYFLVEGRRTESKIYPAWLKQLNPSIERVDNPQDVESNHYYLISGGGYPSLLDTKLKDSIEDVNQSGKFDYLVICLDADDLSIQQRMEEVTQHIQENNFEILEPCKLKIVVQNKTIETWLLGNKKVFPRRPNDQELRDMIKFYNVSIEDPEGMGTPDGSKNFAEFHFHYLKLMLAEKGIRYTKKYPRDVVKPTYLAQLVRRVEKDNTHLKSLQNFLEFCEHVEQESSV